jgi:hypothetical protein
MNALADGSQLYYNPPIYNKGGVYQALTVRANGKVTSHLYTGSVNELISANAISTGEWVHLAVTWNPDGRKIWINGVLNGTSSTSLTAMDAGGNNATFHIGEGTSDSHTGLNAYVDELRVSKIDRYTSNFTPYTAALTEDSNTTLLIHSDTDNNSTTFTDSSGVIGGPGNDQTGNENHFTPFGISATDVMTDTPTNNFATMIPASNITLSEGNTKGVTTRTGNWDALHASIGLTSGKWYFEIKESTSGTFRVIGGVAGDPENWGNHFNGRGGTGDVTSTFNQTTTPFYGNGSWLSYWYDHQDVGTSAATALSSGDIVQFALDLDNYKLYIGVNGTFYDNDNSADGNPAGGLKPTVTIPSGAYTGRTFFPAFIIRDDEGSDDNIAEINFGNPSFSISSGNADANGYGNFEFAVPSGFYSLCTKNLGEFG